MKTTTETILVLGVTGMLGNAVFRYLSSDPRYKVWGTARNGTHVERFNAGTRNCIVTGIDVLDIDQLHSVFLRTKPTVAINCIGLVKQLADAEDPLIALPINSLLPHRLAKLCALTKARLVHLSTDCVFSGNKGCYVEDDAPDARDVYGLSKHLGEVSALHCVTLRTSIIGRELAGSRSLVDWFLAQKGSVKGYTRAVFSGLPTVEVARVISNYVLPNPALHGLYHLAAQPIAKFDLLGLIATAFGKEIEIQPNDGLVIDRSLDASRFNSATGYTPPCWSDLIAQLRDFS